VPVVSPDLVTVKTKFLVPELPSIFETSLIEIVGGGGKSSFVIVPIP